MRTEEKAGIEGKTDRLWPLGKQFGGLAKEKMFSTYKEKAQKGASTVAVVHNCSPSTSGSRGSLRPARDFTAISCLQRKMVKEELLHEIPLPTTQGALGPTSKEREGEEGKGGKDSPEERRRGG